MTPLIFLASASPTRIAMLENAGVPFTPQAARIDELAVKQAMLAEGAKPRDVADALAEMKAQRISAKNPGALVIGSDQVVELNGTLLSKPENLTEARAQLISLRNQEHKLLSAVVIVKDGQPQWRHVGQARLWMRDFSDTFLTAYLDRLGNDATATVGSYKLEAEGIRLFSRIEGDYFTILGMPLLEVLTYLTTIGALPK